MKFTVETLSGEQGWVDAGAAIDLDRATNIAEVAFKFYQTPVRVLEDGEVIFSFSPNELWN